MQFTGARVVLVALTGVVLGALPVSAASAAPAPSPTPTSVAAADTAKRGTPFCTIADKNAIELSGLVSANGFLYAVNDGTETSARKKLFKFDNSECKLVGQAIGYPSPGPADPEDLAVDPDGKTIWIGDIGDNEGKRATAAVWKVVDDKIDGPYRMTYPDGVKPNAEALLIGADGLPIIITKTADGSPAKIYVATKELEKGTPAGVPLKLAGEVTLPKTETPNPYTVAGRMVVTGAAMSPDKTKVVLRSYADAFEWTVSNGDIVGALTQGKPRITPLPEEPLGEAIAYSADGTRFLTVSETERFTEEEKKKPVVLSYEPSTQTQASPPAPAAQGRRRRRWATRWAASPARRASRWARTTPPANTALGSPAWRPSTSRASSWP